ncbi:hypothetical protein Y1Q_0019512 [Alligator mississippiensis]|uniref:HECT domain-containing protein n=1 Tax=Alligator mississippiensis TaxID=8496 RepID=A0A151NMI8_ALLMI|nr:hypothetical protein Y1Q_0019512 [Alligator mississippiensis]
MWLWSLELALIVSISHSLSTSNLQKVLNEEYDDVLEEMMLDITVMKKGESIVTVELKENGPNIPITKHNRKEYIDVPFSMGIPNITGSCWKRAV